MPDQQFCLILIALLIAVLAVVSTRRKPYEGMFDALARCSRKLLDIIKKIPGRFCALFPEWKWLRFWDAILLSILSAIAAVWGLVILRGQNMNSSWWVWAVLVIGVAGFALGGWEIIYAHRKQGSGHEGSPETADADGVGPEGISLGLKNRLRGYLHAVLTVDTSVKWVFVGVAVILGLVMFMMAKVVIWVMDGISPASFTIQWPAWVAMVLTGLKSIKDIAEIDLAKIKFKGTWRLAYLIIVVLYNLMLLLAAVLVLQFAGMSIKL